MLHSVVTLLVCFLVLFWMLFGVRQVMEGLVFFVVLKALNADLAQWPLGIQVLGWLAVFVAGLRVFPRISRTDLPAIGAVLVFGFVAAGLSAIASPLVSVSLLKIAAFSWLISAVLVASTKLSQSDIGKFQSWVAGMLLAIALLSVLTLLDPTIGIFDRGDNLFQGVLNHPQTLGPVLAIPLTWLVADILLAARKIEPVKTLVLLGILVLLLLTRSRTAVAAVILAVLSSYLCALLIRRCHVFRPLRASVLSCVLLCAVLVFVVLSPGAFEYVNAYVFKGADATTVEEAFFASRGAGISTQFQNFLNSPIIGHGFGVFPSGQFDVEPVYFFGIPLSAPVEKGFLPTMVLEEVGIVGGLALAPLMILLTKKALRNHDPRWVATFFAAILVNNGEAVFFSVNGNGLFFWCVIALVLAKSRLVPNARN